MARLLSTVDDTGRGLRTLARIIISWKHKAATMATSDHISAASNLSLFTIKLSCFYNPIIIFLQLNLHVFTIKFACFYNLIIISSP